MPDLTVALEAELAPERLDGLTRDLMLDLNQLGMRAQPVEAVLGPGERGVMAEIGRFVIEALLGGNAAANLLDVIKAYLSRERTLRVSISKPDGTRIEVDAKNIDSGVVAQFLGASSAIAG